MFFKHLSVPLMAAVLGLSFAFLATELRAEPDAEPTPRIATLDWTIAETLMGLGIAPQAVAQIAAYHEWVGKPGLPDDVIDLGLRSQPNLELLASLQPDLILISPMFSNIAPRLSRIAAVETLALYTPGSDTWEQMLQLTRDTAVLAGNPQAGQNLVERTEAAMVGFREQLPSETEPLLIVQFMDARHVRVFGENGLYQAVLDRLGLDNAWTGETNSWGFSLVGLEDLLGIEGQLVVVEPSPLGVNEGLADNGLWQALPDVHDDSVLSLPPVWSFGALPSALRFADALTSALVTKHDH
ncbi:ABC transporter substrate-binding protein [Pseudomonas sp. OIL-1]|uniref:ABC transporter substrate-binding protein n=1 Tax=Pseudomonas sp. OIL-1 TaxID=2706126 RepID=UPI001C499D15|nr:ABC transporter substrate-binding protein [Pseudomonas sp. OIL-1]